MRGREQVATADHFWAISGASGFLGRSLREDLAASLIPSRGLARNGDVEIAADVRDRSAVQALVRGASVVVHLAAYVHRRTRGRQAELACWSTNVDGTQNLIDAVAAENPNAFVVFVSTANVYGASEEALDELAPCRPMTPYGRSKLEAERRFLRSVGEGAIRGCILRPAMIFGTGAPGNLERLARMVRSGWVIEVAHGEQRKSIVPVSLAVGSIRAVASHQQVCNGEVINIAGETLTINEIVAALAGQRQKKPRIVSVPRWLAVPAIRAASLLMPSAAAMAKTFMTSSVLRGDKLGRLTGFHPPDGARAALARLD